MDQTSTMPNVVHSPPVNARTQEQVDEIKSQSATNHQNEVNADSVNATAQGINTVEVISPISREDQRVERCQLCDAKNDRWMVSCDQCKKWYHYRCVGVNDSIKDRDFVCEKCVRAGTKTTRSRSERTHSSKRSSNVAHLRARLEEEHKLKIRMAEMARKLQEQRDLEYATKLQQAEEELLEKKYQLLELSSSSGSSVDKKDLVSNYLDSCGASILSKNDKKKAKMICDANVNPRNETHNTMVFELSKADLLFFEDCKQNTNQSSNMAMSEGVNPQAIVTRQNRIEDTKMPMSNTIESSVNNKATDEPVVQYFADNKSPTTVNMNPLDSLVFPWYTPSKPPTNVEETLTSTGEGTLTLRQIQARTLLGKGNLPEFTGIASEWPVFINAYVRTTKRCGYTNEENLERLLKSLKGKAKQLVQARLISPHTVPSVIETLKRHFGNPATIVDDLIKKAQQVPRIKSENAECFVKLAIAVEDLVQTVENSMMKEELNNRQLLHELVLKLPFHYQMLWTAYSTTIPHVNLSTLSNWLVNIAHTASALPKRDYNETFEKSNSNRGGKRPIIQVSAHDVQNEKRESNVKVEHSSKCLICSEEGHKIDGCTKFTDMTKKQRWTVVVDNRLCRQCLGRHHTKYCKKKKPCGVDNCVREHHPMLHSSQSSTEGTPTSTTTTTRADEVTGSMSHCLNNHEINRSVLYRILPVKLYNKTKSIETFAFMDDGSSTTFIESNIAKQLELEGPVRDLCIRWTSDVSRTEKDSKEVNLEISGLNSTKRRFKLAKIRTVSTLNLPVQTVDEHLVTLDYLKDLPIGQYTYGKPTILIGLDNYDLCVPIQIRKGDTSSPIATKTKLGWVLSGPTGKRTTDIQMNFHKCDQNQDDELNSLVKSFFSLENFGISANIKPVESADDIRSKNVMENTTKFLEDQQRFETGLIWKKSDAILPESKKMAEKRLQCLEKKLEQNQEAKEKVHLQIKSYIEKGYARKLSDIEASQTSQIMWYLPVFTVTNPNKPSKIRLVWDAAAKSHGVSLNDHLLKGPDLLNPLPDVLMRFREKPIAIGGDLVEMFHQVKVIERDQQAQRFLWREDPSHPPQAYIMEVMTFGASCSPSSAQFVLRKNASRFADKYPRAVHAINNNHYVDDWLDSFGTVKEALAVAEQVTKIHEAGGFKIHNWMSNNSLIMSQVKERGAPQKCLTNSEALERVLGMYWRTSDDKFVFVINRNRIEKDIIDGSRIPSKRQVLSATMSTFDPLGLVAPYIMYAKVILQEIWRAGISWDEPIPEAQHEKWKLWTSQFENIEKIAIPRCYTTLWSTNDTAYELHVFVDASELAYAAAAYVCSEKDGVRECSLIASKTRVAPIRPTSIPRLELLGAVLGTRLAKTIQKSQQIVFGRRYFWTDSQTVLQWLKSDARKYRQFVALRVSEILDETDVSEWNWISSSENVADEATKWATTPNFDVESRWYTGPLFLIKSPNYWPKQQELNLKDNTDDELRTVNVHNVKDEFTPVIPNPESFSTWERLIHHTVCTHRIAFRWINRVRMRLKNGAILDEKQITNASAEVTLFKKAQRDAYADEIRSLDKGKYVDRSSKIYGFSPYKDETGLLRVRGRIDKASGILFDTKRPIILPYDHRISFLYVDFLHRKYLHRNHYTVLNVIRQRLLIPKLRMMLRKVRFRCQRCCIDVAKPNPPEMGILPNSRLQTFCMPFSYVGVDYFGPIEVRIGRRVEKRYGCLFTCMTTRAIHVEVAHSLTADSCIMSLLRFMSRRGTPIEISSDNGTNFRGASKELHDMIKDIPTDAFEKKFPEIKWSFIPPSSPHFGGTWERMVRSVKTNLCELLKERRPTDEMLQTCLAQVENIVNSRPLTELPIEDESGEALTPNHLIHGTSNGIKPFFDKSLGKELYKKHWMTVEQITNSFWRRFVDELLPTLTKRTKWFEKAPPLQVGDIVVVVDSKNPKNTWPKGVIVDINRGADGQTRSAVVKTQTGTYTKPTVKLAVLSVKSNVSPTKSPLSSETLTGGDHVGNTANSKNTLPYLSIGSTTDTTLKNEDEQRGEKKSDHFEKERDTRQQ